MKFRKRPIEVEAFKFDPFYSRLGMLRPCRYPAPMWFMQAEMQGKVELWGDDEAPYCMIETLEGRMRAEAGDFIIKGINGELYPCKPDIFEQSYEPVA